MTDDEGTLLALVVRAGPLTAYQIAKVYDFSPVSNFNTSKGKLYPMVKRLRAMGLLDGRPVEGDARGTETLFATSAGKSAVKTWTKQLRPSHVLLEDPLRTKVQSFNLLSQQERLQWIEEAKSQLQAKLEELEEYAGSVEVPFHQAVHDNAVSSIHARIEWLDRLERSLAQEQPKGKAAKA